MPVALRLLGSGLVTAVVQWGLAVASLLAMGVAPTTLWLAFSGVLTAVVTALTYRLMVRRPDEPEDGPEEGRDDDDGGPPPDGPEPPWWPEFERAFREHAARPRVGGQGPA